MSSKVILITGGSRGIGLAAVKRFQNAGWKVAACATTEESLKGSPADLALKCDVARKDDVSAAIGATLAKFGRIDALMNNAGVAGTNPMGADDSDELWHRIVDVNLHGTYYMSKLALPHLPDRTGRIINIGSVLALKGVPDQTAYCAAKHAVLGFTRALSHLAAPRGITVNAICPGWVRTDMATGRMRELELSQEALEAGVPLGRMIEPEEVAAMAEYLTSESASGITGQALTIDGGAMA